MTAHSVEFASWQDFPMDQWRWKNFTAYEMRSKSDGKLMIDFDAMDRLQALRDLINAPIRITSAYRSPAHNILVGGVAKSQHLRARAYDCQMFGHDPAQFEAAAYMCKFTGIGFYPAHDFIHIDTGPKREWGERWFDITPAFTGYDWAPAGPGQAQPSTEQVKRRPRAGKGGLLDIIVAFIQSMLGKGKK